ncbi:MAG: PadR family transcriptional regulator [Candidatus Limnocylindrales bacterium]
MVASPMAELRRGVAEHCVLALIGDGEAYAFDIVRRLTERGLVAGEGTVYPLLARLRREALVETTWRESASGPPRRYHRLTAAGHRALDAFLVDWAGFRDAVEDLLDGTARAETSREGSGRAEP